MMSSKNKNNKPLDPPSTSFTTDPYLENIYNREQFGVVLIAGWPPPQRTIAIPVPSLDQSLPSTKSLYFIQDFYHDFINQVKECFDPIDLLIQCSDNDNNDGTVNTQMPNVYLYPPQHLHITIATFHPVSQSFDTKNNKNTNININHNAYIKACQTIVQNAIRHQDWPKHKINVTVDTAQIGEKAGIILYNDDELRSIQLMRNILKEEYDSFMIRNDSSDCVIPAIPKMKQLIIPNIIHSTFLRFHNHPQTNGALVQQRFQSNVLEKIKDLHCDGCQGRKISIDSVTLVMETRAYMHIPYDSDHVLESLDLI